jgi:hypothetical protein
MSDFCNLVKKELEANDSSPKALELWKSITSWYEEGGPPLVEQGILKIARDINRVAKKQIKETKEVMPKKRKTRR